MMDTDPGIICFQHCTRKVFCFDLPLHCPECSADLQLSHLRMVPFRVPYPFVRASQHQCAIVIKPTVGDFLNDYLNAMDLHIGVTDSKGAVVEFDKRGLQRHAGLSWQQCLVLDQISNEIPQQLWDDTLDLITQQPLWTADNYDERLVNCYSFVLTFVSELKLGAVSKAAACKRVFCEEFIVPRTRAAGRYISLYRRLRTAPHHLMHSPSIASF